MISTPKLKVEKQIFISFAPPDRELAARVASELRGSGLKVVRMDELKPHGKYSDAVRGVLNQSDAVVTCCGKVSDRDQIPASVLLEIGAAVGASKRIFVVVEEMVGKLPFDASHLQVLPLSRVVEIATNLDD